MPSKSDIFSTIGAMLGGGKYGSTGAAVGAAIGAMLGGGSGSRALTAGALGFGAERLGLGSLLRDKTGFQNLFSSPEKAQVAAVLPETTGAAGAAGAGAGAAPATGAAGAGAAATGVAGAAADAQDPEKKDLFMRIANAVGIENEKDMAGLVAIGTLLSPLIDKALMDENNQPTRLPPELLEANVGYRGGALQPQMFVDPFTGKNVTFAQRQQLLGRAPFNAAAGGIVSAYVQGGYVEGPGTGKSDSINAGIYQNGQKVQEARLSDGEFVMTEQAVRNAGNGNREQGAAKMYALMKQLENGRA